MSLWEPHAWGIGAALFGGLIGAVAVLLFLPWNAVLASRTAAYGASVRLRQRLGP